MESVHTRGIQSASDGGCRWAWDIDRAEGVYDDADRSSARCRKMGAAKESSYNYDSEQHRAVRTTSGTRG